MDAAFNRGTEAAASSPASDATRFSDTVGRLVPDAQASSTPALAATGDCQAEPVRSPGAVPGKLAAAPMQPQTRAEHANCAPDANAASAPPLVTDAASLYPSLPVVGSTEASPGNTRTVAPMVAAGVDISAAAAASAARRDLRGIETLVQAGLNDAPTWRTLAEQVPPSRRTFVETLAFSAIGERPSIDGASVRAQCLNHILGSALGTAKGSVTEELVLFGREPPILLEEAGTGHAQRFALFPMSTGLRIGEIQKIDGRSVYPGRRSFTATDVTRAGARLEVRWLTGRGTQRIAHDEGIARLLGVQRLYGWKDSDAARGLKEVIAATGCTVEEQCALRIELLHLLTFALKEGRHELAAGLCRSEPISLQARLLAATTAFGTPPSDIWSPAFAGWIDDLRLFEQGAPEWKGRIAQAIALEVTGGDWGPTPTMQRLVALGFGDRFWTQMIRDGALVDGAGQPLAGALGFLPMLSVFADKKDEVQRRYRQALDAGAFTEAQHWWVLSQGLVLDGEIGRHQEPGPESCCKVTIHAPKPGSGLTRRSGTTIGEQIYCIDVEGADLAVSRPASDRDARFKAGLRWQALLPHAAESKIFRFRPDNNRALRVGDGAFGRFVHADGYCSWFRSKVEFVWVYHLMVPPGQSPPDWMKLECEIVGACKRGLSLPDGAMGCAMPWRGDPEDNLLIVPKPRTSWKDRLLRASTRRSGAPREAGYTMLAAEDVSTEVDGRGDTPLLKKPEAEVSWTVDASGLPRLDAKNRGTALAGLDAAGRALASAGCALASAAAKPESLEERVVQAMINDTPRNGRTDVRFMLRHSAYEIVISPGGEAWLWSRRDASVAEIVDVRPDSSPASADEGPLGPRVAESWAEDEFAVFEVRWIVAPASGPASASSGAYQLLELSALLEAPDEETAVAIFAGTKWHNCSASTAPAFYSARLLLLERALAHEWDELVTQILSSEPWLAAADVVRCLFGEAMPNPEGNARAFSEWFKRRNLFEKDRAPWADLAGKSLASAMLATGASLAALYDRWQALGAPDRLLAQTMEEIVGPWKSPAAVWAASKRGGELLRRLTHSLSADAPIDQAERTVRLNRAGADKQLGVMISAERARSFGPEMTTLLQSFRLPGMHTARLTAVDGCRVAELSRRQVLQRVNNGEEAVTFSYVPDTPRVPGEFQIFDLGPTKPKLGAKEIMEGNLVATRDEAGPVNWLIRPDRHWYLVVPPGSHPAMPLSARQVQTRLNPEGVGDFLVDHLEALSVY